MATYELVNPSDAIAFDAVSLPVAIVATLFVGEGRYPLRCDGQIVFGAVAFGRGNVDQYCRSVLGGGLNETLESVSANHTPDLIAALDSFRLTAGERTSLNDICGRARRLAAAMRGDKKETAA